MPSDPRQHPSYQFYYDIYKEAADKAKAAKAAKEEEARRAEKDKQDAAFNQALGVAGATTAGAVAVPLVTEALTSEGGSSGGGLLSGLLGGGSEAAVVEPIKETTLVPAASGGVSASGSAGAGGAVTGGSSGGGLFSLGGVGSAGNAILPVAGGLGIADVIMNERGGIRGPLQGAASGAAIGSYFGPVGTIVGGVGGGLIGLGQSFFGDRETTDEERARRARELAEKGIKTHHDSLGTDPTQRGGFFREDLAADFIGFDNDGTWVNNKFAKSRNVNDLKPEDIWGHFAFYEKFGNDWLGKFSEDQRRTIAQRALDSKIVTEGRGQIGFSDEKKLDEIVAEVTGEKKEGDPVGDAVANAISQPVPRPTPDTIPGLQTPHPERFELV